LVPISTVLPFACLLFSFARNTSSSYLATHVSIFRFHICTRWHWLDTCSIQRPLLSFERFFPWGSADKWTIVQIALDRVDEPKVAWFHHKVFLSLELQRLFKLLLQFSLSASSIKSKFSVTFPMCLDLCHQAYAICGCLMDSQALQTRL